ncbi:MAG: GatB/YqeY domain-containing protein [Chloroflexota bacterium]|nr:GatB/YqeY domain-containing protein [Chloroflexota bacterium]MDE2907565.1 GatB/YqeY domain-containing protein [Chloroflexota bacterium]
MKNLKHELQNALKIAMKAKDRERRDAIRLLQSAIKQAEIDGRSELDDDAILDILRREAKKRRETISELERAGRSGDADSERFELAVTEAFLPRQLSSDELKPIVQGAIAEVGATSPKEMGQVMRAVMPKVRGLADGKTVNAIVRELLS